MKIVIAPDSYKESLTALEVANAIEKGFKQVLPHASYVKVPMADGGEGTVQSLVDATQGRIISQPVTDPLGHTVDGFFGLLGGESTAVIEMAAASGLHLVPRDQRNPLVTTSFGTGELIKAALDLGVNHLIIGIGGSATNDAGLGMAQALGIRFLDENGAELGFGANQLQYLNRIDLSGLDPRIADTRIEIACDVDNPLCGETGASFVFGPQKGASQEMCCAMDGFLNHWANIVAAETGVHVHHLAGAGAAGGLGGALVALLGAELKSGIDLVIQATQLKATLAGADLVITGEGRIDSQTIHGKTPIGVARCAKQYQIPTIGIAGSISADCGVVHEHGLDAVFSVVNGAIDLPTALQQAAENVELTARNIAAMYAQKI